eukprot:350027-Chlamydomonas_euryale.AAC.4
MHAGCMTARPARNCLVFRLRSKQVTTQGGPHSAALHTALCGLHSAALHSAAAPRRHAPHSYVLPRALRSTQPSVWAPFISASAPLRTPHSAALPTALCGLPQPCLGSPWAYRWHLGECHNERANELLRLPSLSQ